MAKVNKAKMVGEDSVLFTEVFGIFEEKLPSLIFIGYKDILGISRLIELSLILLEVMEVGLMIQEVAAIFSMTKIRNISAKTMGMDLATTLPTSCSNINNRRNSSDCPMRNCQVYNFYLD
jgi:hypothetical protein